MPLPASLALTSIADSSSIVAADHRNNYASIQTAVNAIIAEFSNGAADGDPMVWDLSNGKWVSASTLTASKRLLPGQELAYVEFTAPVTANAVAEAAATSIVSAGAVTFDGATAVLVEFFCPALVTGGATSTVGINLWDGATDLGRLFDGTTVSTPAGNLPGGVFKRKLTPSAAAHTYSIRIWSNSATNFIAEAGAGGAGVKLPGYVRITRA